MGCGLWARAVGLGCGVHQHGQWVRYSRCWKGRLLALAQGFLSKCTRKVRIRVIFEHLVEKQPSKVRIWYKSSSKVRIWDKNTTEGFPANGAVGCGLWAVGSGWGSGCGLVISRLKW